jgi:hypothetical protein
MNPAKLLAEADALLAAHGMAPAPAGKRKPKTAAPTNADLRALAVGAPPAPKDEPEPPKRPTGRRLDLRAGLARALRAAEISPARVRGRGLLFLADGTCELVSLNAMLRWLSARHPELAEALERVADGAAGFVLASLKLTGPEPSRSSVVALTRVVAPPGQRGST